MGRVSLALLALCALVCCTTPAFGFDGWAEPRPPVLPDPAAAWGTLTIPSRNVSGNATIYYSYADRGKLRVDQDAGGGEVHTYFGDKSTSASTFIVSHNPLVCYQTRNSSPLPDPNFFRKAQFMGRVKVNGMLTQRWCTSTRDERGCNGKHPSSQIDLYVEEGSSPARPVRMSFWGWQLDFWNFRPGLPDDPTVWDIPKCRNSVENTFESMMRAYSAAAMKTKDSKR